MQIRQRIFKCTDVQFFSWQNSKTFDISHTFLPLTVTKLSTLKNSPFLAHPVFLICAFLESDPPNCEHYELWTRSIKAHPCEISHLLEPPHVKWSDMLLKMYRKIYKISLYFTRLHRCLSGSNNKKFSAYVLTDVITCDHIFGDQLRWGVSIL